MIQDIEQTIVKFLMGPSKDLFAYFTEIEETKGYKSCYSHIGQHSTCSVEYAKRCKLAIKREYKDLQKELEQIGYNLKILNEEL